jgi:probable F420-dependent oxidoreductase
MRIGVAIPQREIASDPVALSAFAAGVEELGYAHVLVFDHVVGAARDTRPDWDGPYDLSDPFHEPFMLLAWIASRTTEIGLATGVLILPQRQTALVAKQAAELDLLSGGRLRLGVGVGWNRVEYQALGSPFGVRGARIEEQVRLLREYWTEEHVTFQGRWDQVEAAGLNPRPVQRPIPIWMGGSANAVLERAARLADGWMPMIRPDLNGSRLVRSFRQLVHERGERREPIGLEARLSLRLMPPSRWGSEVDAWSRLDATHMTVNTSGLGLRDVDEHLQLLGRLRSDFAARVEWQKP